MEFVFGIIALLVTVLMVYGIGRLIYDHNDLVRAYKRSEELVLIHSVFGMLMWFTWFITLCACNNTFWHLPYLTLS